MPGKRVCAHSSGALAMRDAIRAGVDCLEHAYFLDDDVAQLMVEHATFLVPTICVSRAEDYFRRIGAAEWEIRKSAEANARHWSALQTAIRHGVKIAMGTDMLPGEMNEGTVATYREMEFMAEAGLTPMQVLMAATRVGAEVVHAEDQFGTLEPGQIRRHRRVRRQPRRADARLTEYPVRHAAGQSHPIRSTGVNSGVPRGDADAALVGWLSAFVPLPYRCCHRPHSDH